jgi:hypothetical protein
VTVNAEPYAFAQRLEARIPAQRVQQRLDGKIDQAGRALGPGEFIVVECGLVLAQSEIRAADGDGRDVFAS